VVCYLARFEYFRYKYKICNPKPAISKNMPKLAFEMIMHKIPLTMQMAGTLFANTLKSNFILEYHKEAPNQMQTGLFPVLHISAFSQLLFQVIYNFYRGRVNPVKDCQVVADVVAEQHQAHHLA